MTQDNLDQRRLEAFNDKWPTVAQIVKFHADRWKLRPADREDFEGEARLALWAACVERAGKTGAAINARLVALAGFRAWAARARRDRERLAGRQVMSVDASAKPTGGMRAQSIGATIPARGTATVRVGGVKLTPADAGLAPARLVRLLEHGIGSAELARQLGCSRQAVERRPEQFGGYRFAGIGWRFPAGG